MSRFQDRRTNSQVAPWSRNYLLAVAAVVVCSSAAVVFGAHAREAPFLFFWPAVLFAFWIGGFGPALFSSVLSSIAVNYFLLPPYFSILNPHKFAKDLFFVGTVAMAAWFFEQRFSRSEGSVRLKQKLLEAAAESILITDAGHRVIFWNRGAAQLYGWAESEAMGQKPRTLLETIYPEPLENIDRQIQESGRWQGQLRRTCRDGTIVITESSWALDQETGYILQTDLDVTEQCRAASELKRINRALSALSRVNQALIHSSTEDQLLQHVVEIMVQEVGYPLVWIAIPQDNPQHSVKVGPHAGTAVEYLSDIEVTWGDEPSGRGPCGSALREGRICVAHNFLAEPDCVPWREIAEKHHLRSLISLPLIVQGKTRAALTLYATEENAFEDDEFNLISEVASDSAFGLTSIRLRKQAEEERLSRVILEDQFRQAQKMEAIGRLAGGIAHDFNNLLMVIMAQTELLSMQVTGPALERAQSVMNSAERAAELTHQLLAFSRKQIVQPKILSLNQILTDVAKMAGHLLGKDVEIKIALCPQPWLVKVDRSQIEQVIMNLIVNARDAMPNGGKLTLETANADLTTEYIAAHPLILPGRYALLAVSDDGVGMSAETQARLFEPFFTTKEPGKGTGLGLSVVYGIVKQSNGFIWCDSELGKGSCFKIYLPVTEMQEFADDPATPSEAASALKQATILLVENEHALREVICQFLISAGHTVITAESQEKAFERASEHDGSISLLLTDIVLGGQSGKQVADSLRDKGGTFKVIYMSGYTPDAIVQHGVLEQETMFLQKPFTRATLLAKVQEALRQ